ncbi:hypothetical protein M2175_007021 [Bradyrhizobium elkanii]|uniref:ATP-dependent DNA ligase n=1 Tax=Bradyrhizobium TaxID=374 RepID=UPI002167198E|nr:MULTISPECIES: hypothetical protein [Bradyrhizobium]MCS3931990.1 hypothetical protein [Bradyrhizobium elkanii]MCS3972548.1 hypothetical protein [Bradyrhizobium japonicum]
MARVSTLPKRLQPMLATLTDAPFDDKGWIFEDKYDGFRMVARVDGGKVTLYSCNGKIISHSYIEVAQALEGVKGDAVIDGELVAIGKDGASHFQLLQNAPRHEARLQYFVFDLMFQEGEDLRRRPLTERRKRLKAILPKHKLIGFSRDRKTFGVKFFEEAERADRRSCSWHHLCNRQRSTRPWLLKGVREGRSGKALQSGLLLGKPPFDELAFQRQKPGTQELAVAADVVMMGTKACQVFVHRHLGLRNYAAAAARSVERRRKAFRGAASGGHRPGRATRPRSRRSIPAS